jgi:hypothetical protein
MPYQSENPYNQMGQGLGQLITALILHGKVQDAKLAQPVEQHISEFGYPQEGQPSLDTIYPPEAMAAFYKRNPSAPGSPHMVNKSNIPIIGGLFGKKQEGNNPNTPPPLTNEQMQNQLTRDELTDPETRKAIIQKQTGQEPKLIGEKGYALVGGKIVKLPGEKIPETTTGQTDIQKSYTRIAELSSKGQLTDLENQELQSLQQKIKKEVEPRAITKDERTELAYRSEKGISPEAPIDNSDFVKWEDNRTTQNEARKEIVKSNALFQQADAYVKKYKLAERLLDGTTAPAEIGRQFKMPGIVDAAVSAAQEKDPNYNQQRADANFNWYKSPNTQRLIRRTESVVAPGGSIDEAIRIAKLVKNPAGTKINQLTGFLGKQFGNSQRALLDVAHGLVSEETQQIMGANGGGQKFLDYTDKLNDSNMSVLQYINNAKEMKYGIIVRQLSNVKGTPDAKNWEKYYEQAKKDRPFAEQETTSKYSQMSDEQLLKELGK